MATPRLDAGSCASTHSWVRCDTDWTRVCTRPYLCRPGILFCGPFEPMAYASAHEQPVGRLGWLGIGQPRHPGAVEQAEERGEEGDEQRDLERDRSRLGVDVDDLGVHVFRLAGQSF